MPAFYGAPGELMPPAEHREQTINDRLDNRLLDSRVTAAAVIFKVLLGVHNLAVHFPAKPEFRFIPTPACVAYRFPGEDDDHFMLPFFDRTAMLAPTGEIHLGMALAADLERVYDFYTVFRREPASDGRHLTESNELDDLTREEEAALGNLLATKESGLGHPTDIFIVTHFPRHLRPCNVYQSDEDSITSQSFDVVMKGQEIVTGHRLIHDYEKIRSAFETRTPPIDPDSPEWRPYMIAHEIGMPPWGGFGLGINRLVQGLVGLSDIRETVLFLRDAARLTP